MENNDFDRVVVHFICTEIHLLNFYITCGFVSHPIFFSKKRPIQTDTNEAANFKNEVKKIEDRYKKISGEIIKISRIGVLFNRILHIHTHSFV